MQKKFIDLLRNFKDEKIDKINNSAHNEDLIELIFYSDKMKVDLKQFLNALIKKFNSRIINDIYANLFKKTISENLKKIIINFFVENASVADPLIILQLIDNCPSLSLKILENLKEVIIKKEEFFELESKNMKLFQGLFERKILLGNEFSSTAYVKNNIVLLSSLQKDIEEGNIYYKEIIHFYSKNKQEELNKKLLLISSNNKELALKLQKIIDNYMKEIEVIKNDLTLVYNDLKEFLFDSQKDDINILVDIIYKINNGYLNCYEKNYKEQCKDLINTYKEKAQLRTLMKKNSFFTTIYENKKECIKNVFDCINQTELKFNELSNIFSNQPLHSLDQDILNICANSVKGKKENDIIKEVDLLMNIFKKDLNSSEYNKNQIVQSLIILSKRVAIYIIAKAIIIFIDKIGAIKKTFYSELGEIISKLNNSFMEEEVLKAIDRLKKFNIDIDILYKENYEKDNYINILIELSEQPDSILFLLKRNIDDCLELKVLLRETNNGILSVDDILDLEKCIKLINKVGTEKTIKGMNDFDIVKSFIQEIEENKDMKISFIKFLKNYKKLKTLESLYYYGLNTSEASEQKIELICHNSRFVLKNIKNEFYNGIYDGNFIKMDSLLKLRKKVQLNKIIRDDEDGNKILENNKFFIEKVSEICNIHNLLYQIYMIGYPEEITIQMNINDFKSNFSGFGKNYQDIISKLKNIINEFKNILLKVYKEKPLIRFIYGRQFNLIYNYLIKRNEAKMISPFLNFFTNNLIKEEIVDFKYQSTGNLYDDLFNNIEKYLEQILLKNDLNMEIIYKDSLIKSKGNGYQYKGVFLYLCSQFDKDAFQIYKYLTESIPNAQNVLLCNKEITNEELISFLYRAILCEFNSCFIIAGIELLEFDKKCKLLEILNLLLSKDHNYMKSCLIFLNSSKNSDIYKSLESLKYRKILNLPRQIENLKINDDKIEIISSDESGVGKSTQIRLQIINQNKYYIYFPIGGIFTKEEVIERLKNLFINKNSIIHFDLYDSNQTEQMMEFLFSILITKFYGQNEDIFYLPKEIGIKVEIPNGDIDFIKKFPILKLFHNYQLLIKNLPPLIVPNDFLSNNIQIVANYLKDFNEDKIDKTDLYFERITPEDFNLYKTKENARILSQKECQQLIFKEIKKTIASPNYYQITSFINVLASQFKQFNQNFYLNAHMINKIHNGDSIKIRSFIVESFIKITKRFIEGVINKIVKKKKANKIIFGEYNESKDNEEGIKDLSNTMHSVISFKDIDPSLVFFHEGNSQLFSIITNKDRNDSEYQDLYNLKNCQVINQNEYKVDLPDYKSYTHLQFLRELKDILNVKNPVEKKNAREGERSLEEIAGNYVITADNFVKMVLILLKIRAKNPVIMMGETGCGKTLLIRKLSEMLNDGECKMKILNIHN